MGEIGAILLRMASKGKIVDLYLYNTLTQSKDRFEPLEPGRVGMYVCGPTVYGLAHIGNARPVVAFDVLYRLLRHFYNQVVYVRNITDVDDKINAKAKETGESIRSITERTTHVFHQDMAALGALDPVVEPRATEHIPQMIALIERLLEAGHAYTANGGHVLFDVPSMANYGRLSRCNRDQMIAGARVDVASYKKDPADFVLWKPSQSDIPGWDSPWGRGRPGWHLECSAMSSQYLGETFDIHGGGQDLIFPHHENEIAQSTCAHGGKPFARYWIHNGYLMAEGEKMSKSLGNFYTVHDLLREYPGEAIRLTLLQTHYRAPLDFRKAKIGEARRVLDRFYGALRHAADVEALEFEIPKPVLASLADDLNTSLALSHMHELAGLLNKAAKDEEKAAIKGQLLAAGRVMGLLGQNPKDWFCWQPAIADGSLDSEEIDLLIKARSVARKNKDFAKADHIRDDLAAQGVILEDGAGKTAWRRE